MNKNIEWVTFLKAFGIISVILGHIASPFTAFIFSWHMPLFFMISGFFIKIDNNLNDLIVKDWKRLMIPYFIFAIMALLITSLKLWVMHRDQLDYFNELIGIFFWMDYKHLINSYAFVLWFLPTLFFAKIFYYIIKKLISNLLFQTCAFLFLFIISFQIQLPFALSNAMNGVLWIFIGSFLFNFLSRESKVLFSRYIFVFISLISVVLIAIFYEYWEVPKLDMSSLIYGNKSINVLWATSLFLLFIYYSKAIANKWKSSGIIEQWAGGTMLLFIIHPYTNNISYIIVENFHFGGWFLKLLISLILLQLILKVKQRYSNLWIFKYV